MSAAHELLRGSVWSFRSLDDDEPKPVVIVSNDGRNRSRFQWVHVVRITTRPKRPLPTIVELSDRDAPLTGRAMTDELELVHKGDLEERRGMLSPSTMAAIDSALRDVLALHGPGPLRNDTSHGASTEAPMGAVLDPGTNRHSG